MLVNYVGLVVLPPGVSMVASHSLFGIMTLNEFVFMLLKGNLKWYLCIEFKMPSFKFSMFMIFEILFYCCWTWWFNTISSVPLHTQYISYTNHILFLCCVLKWCVFQHLSLRVVASAVAAVLDSSWWLLLIRGLHGLLLDWFSFVLYHFLHFNWSSWGSCRIRLLFSV